MFRVRRGVSCACFVVARVDSTMIPITFGMLRSFLDSIEPPTTHFHHSNSFFLSLSLPLSCLRLSMFPRLLPRNAAETPSEQALVTTFDMLLKQRIVGKAAFASWYQGYRQHQAKHGGSRPQHPIMQDFFQKRVMT